jgi:hypothetical protein
MVLVVARSGRVKDEDAGRSGWAADVVAEPAGDKRCNISQATLFKAHSSTYEVLPSHTPVILLSDNSKSLLVELDRYHHELLVSLVVSLQTVFQLSRSVDQHNTVTVNTLNEK